jgi:hypothetical protein
MERHGEPAVYNIPEVARVLGRTEAATRHLIARNLIPARRLGGRIIVLADELEEHLRSLRCAMLIKKRAR